MNAKRCAHIASTKLTECPELRNQGGVIGQPISGFFYEFIRIITVLCTMCNFVEIPCVLEGKIGLVCWQLLHNLDAMDIF